MKPLPSNDPTRENFVQPTLEQLSGRVYELECRVSELMAAVRLLANLVDDPTIDMVNSIVLQTLRLGGFPLKVNLPTGDRREMPATVAIVPATTSTDDKYHQRPQ